MSIGSHVLLGLTGLVTCCAAQPTDSAGALSQFAISQLTGSGAVAIQALTADSAGNVYLAAATAAADLPIVNAAQQSGSLYIAKLSTGGDVQWATYAGGPGGDTVVAIAIDDQGNLLVDGTTVLAAFPVTLPRIGTPGKQNGFLTKYDQHGQILFSVVFGGDNTDAVRGLALDSQGAAYVAGITTSSSFPARRARINLSDRLCLQ